MLFAYMILQTSLMQYCHAAAVCTRAAGPYKSLPRLVELVATGPPDQSLRPSAARLWSLLAESTVKSFAS